jgi:hypothetical protein
MDDIQRFLAYSLRYYPSLVTGEFLNVGVALVIPSRQWWNVRLATDLRGFQSVFRKAQPAVLQATLRELEKRADTSPARRSRRELNLIDRPSSGSDPLGPVRAALGNLNGSLRWSDEPTEGVTMTPDEELERWFELLVHVQQTSERRTSNSADEEGLRFLLRRAFERKRILSRFQRTELGQVLREEFEFTHRNGRINVFEPLSLDAKRAGTILNRGQLWRGKLEILAEDAGERLAFYGLVSLPEEKELQREADRAAGMIEAAHLDEVRLISADRLDEFAELADEVTRG